MGLHVMILVFRMLSFKPTFSLSSFTFIKRLFSSSLSAIRVVSSAYLRLLIFLPATLISACVSSSPAFRMMCSAYKLNKHPLRRLLRCFSPNHSLHEIFLKKYGPFLKSSLNLLQHCFWFYVLVFWPQGTWVLSSPIWDGTHTPFFERSRPNHWATREVPTTLPWWLRQ